MKEALKAYLWWFLGVLSVVALGYAYQRRLLALNVDELEQPAGDE